MVNKQQQFKNYNNLSKVYAIIVTKQDGTRIYSKFYDKMIPENYLNVKEGNLKDLASQIAFEKNINQISSKLTIQKQLKPEDTEIFIYQFFNIIFKHFGDCSIFLMADYDENEMFMNEVLKTIYESMNYFCQNQINNRSLQQNFDNLITTIDEVIDDGLIVILDSQIVISRVQMLGTDNVNEQQQTQQSSYGYFSSYFSTAKNQIKGYIG